MTTKKKERARNTLAQSLLGRLLVALEEGDLPYARELGEELAAALGAARTARSSDAELTTAEALDILAQPDPAPLARLRQVAAWMDAEALPRLEELHAAGDGHGLLAAVLKTIGEADPD